MYLYAELEKATKNFKEELGKGASGVVYKGVLADERVVAVKALADIYQAEEVFWAEINTEFSSLEYAESKPLDKHLFPPNFLGWKESLKRKIQSGEDEWIEDMLDPRLEGVFSRNQAAKMVEICMSCVEEDRNIRPRDSVVQMLLEYEEEPNIQM
ncbi:PREDICTED: putative receptor kinase ZmPK1 [Prunus dulcis]|uniref:PREDICTED: putative receptor kinase ZmPK1 n=1 Tax=Prunus dulcis TaxID=3755 RepID=A0A5E4G7K5_PRUDU|nr:PREDICTED: putative receptor kinase ZmPK1 [Prunus dulcis]